MISILLIIFNLYLLYYGGDFILFQNKRKHILILFISILIVSPFFLDGRLFKDDSIFHILRIEGIAQNILNKNFFSGVYQNFLNGFGYGVGLFYSGLFLYIPAFFILLGFSSDTVYLIFLIIINIATFYSIYYCLNHILNDNKINLILSILYLIMPYRIINLYIRGAIGELLALIFIPFVVLGTYEIFYRNKNKYYLLIIGMLGLLHSHLLTLVIMSSLILLISIINIKNDNIKEKLFYLLKSAIFSIALGCNFLFSMIEQLYIDKFYLSINKINKNSVIFNLLDVNDIFKLIFNIIFIILLIYIINKNSNKTKINNLFVTISLISIYSLIILTDFFPWNIFYFILNFIQFPFRLHCVFTIALFVCIIYFIKIIPNNDIEYILTNKYNQITKIIFLFFFIFLSICLLTIVKFYINFNLEFFIFFILICVLLSNCISFSFYRKKIFHKTKFILFLINSITITSLICLLLLSSFCYTSNENFKHNKAWLKNNESYYSNSNSNYIIGKEYIPLDTNLNKINSNDINNQVCYYDKYSYIEFKNPKNDYWLEIPKIYYKGYKTFVNNIEVENRPSKNKFIEVNVKNIESGNIITLYKGTTFSNFTLVINCIFIIYLIIKLLFNKILKLNKF